ncbi:hypothetical protein SAMD00019534_117470 [Acytostelium subglobosum LB1]|uniref:hypothetical protein n=1 Tax=Acytostelium subglobosum LB1 TaxID=1410327 RepID=UPI0006449A88|nr:hypothetical protein SAMD00019534_117470 [Acytostelium subglobosum LB1]GAM28571.1 hypothetical protein SAMD00019534_117470 [Acytostelium subglobosum LB1]|eukprot:XP_012748349.1 hypothetical protein SAMD00019534_117470 [Acytostelium subglobosum LB1]
MTVSTNDTSEFRCSRPKCKSYAMRGQPLCEEHFDLKCSRPACKRDVNEPGDQLCQICQDTKDTRKRERDIINEANAAEREEVKRLKSAARVEKRILRDAAKIAIEKEEAIKQRQTQKHMRQRIQSVYSPPMQAHQQSTRFTEMPPSPSSVLSMAMDNHLRLVSPAKPTLSVTAAQASRFTEQPSPSPSMASLANYDLVLPLRPQPTAKKEDLPTLEDDDGQYNLYETFMQDPRTPNTSN